MGLLLLSLIACKKENPAYYDQLALTPYHIDTFSYFSYYGLDTVKFTYSPWGDPLTGTRNHVQPGFPDFSFRYDKFRRLTDFIGVAKTEYQDDLFWHKYFYDVQGRVNLDSEYFQVTVSNDQITSYSHAYGYRFDYDQYGRITRQYDPNVPSVDSTYTYDARGNLVSPADTLYDDKINYHRTSRIFMFIDRDYSVNNPFHASAYNPGGLPLQYFAFPNETTYRVFLEVNDYREAWIAYKIK